MKWGLRIVVIAGVLVVGWQLHVRQTEVTAIAGVIDQDRAAIDRAETELEILDRDIGTAEDTIRLLDERITRIERRYPRGVPPSERPAYRRLVEERNAVARRQNDLIAGQRELADRYGRLVATHNARVADATALARRGTPGTVVREIWERLFGSE